MLCVFYVSAKTFSDLQHACFEVVAWKELLADNAGYMGMPARLSNKDIESQHAAQRRPTQNARLLAHQAVQKRCAESIPFVQKMNFQPLLCSGLVRADGFAVA